MEAWIEKRGEEATVSNYARDMGVSVWTAADWLAYYVRRGDLREERRGDAFQGVYFGSVYHLSDAALRARDNTAYKSVSIAPERYRNG